MSDVVFLSHGDWANVGSHLAESLRRVGVDAKSCASWHLRMDYPIKSSIYSKWEEVKKDVDEAKVVWIMHGYVFGQRVSYIRKDHLVCAYHGGPPLLDMGGKRSETKGPGFFGRYRRRDLHPVHFIQHPRLYDHCYFLERKHLLSPPVDTQRLQPVYFNGSKRMTIGHFPRNTGTGLQTKGHDKVVKVLRQKKIPCVVNTDFIDWKDHTARVSKCDAYVEKLSTILREWGMTALEAAALGKIVIGQFDNRSTYEKEYGPSPIITANTEEELVKVLDDLVTWDADKIRQKQLETRQWVEKYHSFEAIGKRVKDTLVKEGAEI